MATPDLFLTADKVRPEELEANLPVIVPIVPTAIPEPGEPVTPTLPLQTRYGVSGSMPARRDAEQLTQT